MDITKVRALLEEALALLAPSQDTTPETEPVATNGPTAESTMTEAVEATSENIAST